MYFVAKSSGETNRNSQRAYVSYAGTGLGSRMVQGQPIASSPWTGQQIFLSFANSGDTPARKAVIRTNVQDWPEDLPEGYDFPLDPKKVEAVIGPKANYATEMVIDKEKLDQNAHAKGRIFIWGDVMYRDIFPDDPARLSESCIEITYLTVGWVNPPADKSLATDIDAPNTQLVGFQSNACKQHNCYDKDCKDYDDRVKDMQ